MAGKKQDVVWLYYDRMEGNNWEDWISSKVQGLWKRNAGISGSP